MASFFQRKRGPAELPNVPSYTAKEMEVLKSAITECGINYADVVRAAQTEGGKLAILTAASTNSLKSIVATTATSSAFRRLSEQPKAIVHVSEGVGRQVLLDDRLTHQTTVVHTPSSVYEKMRKKKLKHKKSGDDEELKYRSADICTIQLGITSHLSGYSNQIAGVVLLDGNRSTQEQAILGIGVLPLYEAHSHALFAPRLNIHYDDPNFLNRLQLLTTFSDDVQGSGSPAMSYSTISIVRHNIVDAHFLPEPLPYSKLKEKYPSGVRGLSNFKVTDISTLPPARLTRSASFVPIQRAGPSTVLTFEENCATIGGRGVPQSRSSFSFSDVTYEQSIGQPKTQCAPAVTASSQTCRFHSRPGCPCSQHIDKMIASGPLETIVPASVCGTETFFSSPVSAPHPTDSKFVGSHPFVFAINTDAGTVVHALPLNATALKNTDWGRYFKGYQFLRAKPTVRLTASAPLQAKGLLWLCYDPNETLSKHPSRERALMLQGTWFMPGRHDSVSLTVEHPATPFGLLDMNGEFSGAFKVIVFKKLENFEVTDYGMELSLYLSVANLGLTAVESEITQVPFLPLRQVVAEYELSTTTTKGKVLIFPLDPVMPASDGTHYYPSCSSSILENHRYWKGVLTLEVVFNLPAMAGGLVELAFVNVTVDGSEGDVYRRFGSTIVDLRAQRILRARVDLSGYGGYLEGGGGSLLPVSPVSDYGRTIRLCLLFTSPLHITDTSKKGSFLVRFLGLENSDFLQPTASVGRLTRKSTLVASGGPSVQTGTKDWEEPTLGVIPLGLKQKHFKLYTIKEWPALGYMFFPITPSCHFPEVSGSFEGGEEGFNPLMHRSQENAQWCGTMTYFLTIHLKGSTSSSVSPLRPVVLNAGVFGAIFEKPCFVEKDVATSSMNQISRKGVIHLPTDEEIARFTTPPGRWVNTHFGATEEYTSRTCPAWVLLQFPSTTAACLKIREISIWAEADITYRHPTGGFPVAVPDPIPELTRLWERNFVVG